ncbi:MAG: hypothetical protein K8I60_16175 [Anaerolineae bacterium]|nr:hypothetical protein [Anaerolineae bacterium]
MQKYRTYIAFMLLSILLFTTGCGDIPEEVYSDAIQVYGIVINSEDKPTENITTVVFFDNIEIFRTLTFPLVNRGGGASCNQFPPDSRYVGSSCYNLAFTLPRVAEFNQNGSNIALNLRNIRIGETRTFRSIDGRFLVFQVFEKPPVRSLLLLQADDTVITPLPGTVVLSPTFSARPSPTPKPTSSPTAIPATPSASTSDNSIVDDWIRPFAISIVVGLIVTGVMYFLLAKKNGRNASVAEKPQKRAFDKGKSPDGLTTNPMIIAIFTGTVSGVLVLIIQKLLGL